MSEVRDGDTIFTHHEGSAAQLASSSPGDRAAGPFPALGYARRLRDLREAAAGTSKPEVQPPAQSGTALRGAGQPAAGRADSSGTLQIRAFKPIFKSPPTNPEQCKPLHQHELKSREEQVPTLSSLKTQTGGRIRRVLPSSCLSASASPGGRWGGQRDPQVPGPASGSARFWPLFL